MRVFKRGQEVFDNDGKRRRIVGVCWSVAYFLDGEPDTLYQPDEVRKAPKRLKPKPNVDAMGIMLRIKRAYMKMPHGGAFLHVTDDGAVNNGVLIVARFTSKRRAQTIMKNLGFRKTAFGWKL